MRLAKDLASMTKYEILDRLLADGFRIPVSDAVDVARTIQQAARAGVLRWGNEIIESDLKSRPLWLERTAIPVDVGEWDDVTEAEAMRVCQCQKHTSGSGEICGRNAENQYSFGVYAGCCCDDCFLTCYHRPR